MAVLWSWVDNARGSALAGKVTRSAVGPTGDLGRYLSACEDGFNEGVNNSTIRSVTNDLVNLVFMQSPTEFEYGVQNWVSILSVLTEYLSTLNRGSRGFLVHLTHPYLF